MNEPRVKVRRNGEPGDFSNCDVLLDGKEVVSGNPYNECDVVRSYLDSYLAGRDLPKGGTDPEVWVRQIVDEHLTTVPQDPPDWVRREQLINEQMARIHVSYGRSRRTRTTFLKITHPMFSQPLYNGGSPAENHEFEDAHAFSKARKVFESLSTEVLASNLGEEV